MNLFHLPDPLPQKELTEVLHKGRHVRIERIISTGQASDEDFWYDQSEDEWLTVLQGVTVLRFEDETVQLFTGNTCFIPAHRRHRVDYTSTQPPCVWLCVFSQP